MGYFRPFSSVSFLLFGLILCLASCEGSDGIGSGDLQEDVPRLRGEMDLRIGQFEGEAPYLFGEIADVALDTAGRIWVADLQASEIRVFDRSGRYLFTAGREGEGPGEFSGSRGAYEPCEITVEPGGRIWANAGDRLEVFDGEDGRAEHSFTVSIDPHLECEPVVRIDSTSVTVVQTVVGTDARPTFHLRIDSAGRDLSRLRMPDVEHDSLGWEFIRWTNSDGRESRLQWPPPFPARDLVAHAPNGGYARAITSEYRVQIFDHFGDRIATIDRPTPGPSLTAHESDSVRNRLDSLEAQWSERADSWPDYEVPERKNPIQNIWFEAEGRLWVQVWTHASRSENEAHVYSGDGELRFTVTWPIGIDIDYGASRGRVALGTTEDELGVQRVVRLRLR